MKNSGLGYLLPLVLLAVVSCGPTMSQLKMKEPGPGNCIVVGAILVENNGVDDFFHASKSDIVAVIVGKHNRNGEEVEEGYRVQTDENGYFFLPDVPQGSYVLKGIELDIGFSGMIMITSRWDGMRQIYFPAALMIDHVVRSWPDEIREPVHNMGISYFMIDPSQRIYSDRFPFLRGNTLALKNVVHTMPGPKTYFREKFPNIKSLAE